MNLKTYKFLCWTRGSYAPDEQIWYVSAFSKLRPYYHIHKDKLPNPIRKHCKVKAYVHNFYRCIAT